MANDKVTRPEIIQILTVDFKHCFEMNVDGFWQYLTTKDIKKKYSTADDSILDSASESIIVTPDFDVPDAVEGIVEGAAFVHRSVAPRLVVLVSAVIADTNKKANVDVIVAAVENDTENNSQLSLLDQIRQMLLDHQLVSHSLPSFIS